MKAVFDSNILIDFLNCNETATEMLDSYQHKIISIITCLEVLSGTKNAEEENIAESLFNEFEITDITPAVRKAVVQLRREKRLKLPDAIIYATAKANNCKLVTRNIKDFDVLAADIILPYNL